MLRLDDTSGLTSSKRGKESKLTEGKGALGALPQRKPCSSLRQDLYFLLNRCSEQTWSVFLSTTEQSFAASRVVARSMSIPALTRVINFLSLTLDGPTAVVATTRQIPPANSKETAKCACTSLRCMTFIFGQRLVAHPNRNAVADSARSSRSCADGEHYRCRAQRLYNDLVAPLAART